MSGRIKNRIRCSGGRRTQATAESHFAVFVGDEGRKSRCYETAMDEIEVGKIVLGARRVTSWALLLAEVQRSARLVYGRLTGGQTGVAAAAAGGTAVAAVAATTTAAATAAAAAAAAAGGDRSRSRARERVGTGVVGETGEVGMGVLDEVDDCSTTSISVVAGCLVARSVARSLVARRPSFVVCRLWVARSLACSLTRWWWWCSGLLER
jgi:hypothetical protein